MSAAFTDAEIDALIADLKTQLTENSAALSKARNSLQHSMDTGQTRVNIQRQQVSQLSNERERIIREIEYWCSMKSTATSASHYARPGW